MEELLRSVIRHLRGIPGPFTSQRCRLVLLLLLSGSRLNDSHGGWPSSRARCRLPTPYPAIPSCADLQLDTLFVQSTLSPSPRLLVSTVAVLLAAPPSAHYPPPPNNTPHHASADRTHTLGNSLRIGRSITRTRVRSLPTFAPALRAL